MHNQTDTLTDINKIDISQMVSNLRWHTDTAIPCDIDKICKIFGITIHANDNNTTDLHFDNGIIGQIRDNTFYVKSLDKLIIARLLGQYLLFGKRHHDEVYNCDNQQESIDFACELLVPIDEFVMEQRHGMRYGNIEYWEDNMTTLRRLSNKYKLPESTMRLIYSYYRSKYNLEH